MNEIPKMQHSLLLVDDSASNLAILASALAEYRLVTAADGLQALDIVSREQPDLILLDIRMPGMDGYETCRRLKQQAGTEHIPVIFVTGLDDEEDEAQGFTLGAADYITKPIRPAILRMRVAAHLQLKVIRDQLALIAETDELTGISNRRHFETIMHKEWNRALRNGKPLCLIMIDVDYFKEYNDHYGHAAGDVCLKAVAASVAGSLRRASDLAARLGGDEFVCLLPEITREQAVDLADQMLRRIRGLDIVHAGSAVADCITISLGLASLDVNEHTTWQALLELADQALYRAKQQRRNRLVAAS